MDKNIVTVTIVGGPSVDVAWVNGMNAQQALEEAYVAIKNSQSFTFALQYFNPYGYLVVMINETYETFASSTSPYFYWEFFLNGSPSSTGIDGTILNCGDIIAFEFQLYTPEKHATTTVGAKHEAKQSLR
ncbi:hypothetical protein NIES25_03260 [Nostoc linckia NIES-25]|nr:hypothetical protein NIES25_03260 [Nostoc linckia NIES-25]